MRIRDAAQELHELGLRGAAFRASWEVRTRAARFLPHRPMPLLLGSEDPGSEWISHLPLEDPVTLARWMRPLIEPDRLDVLRRAAAESGQGRIQCFGRWVADYGRPIRWHRNPETGREWNSEAPGIEALSDQSPGDIKNCWEIARFPHAYQLARSATFFPEDAERNAAILVEQIAAFSEANPIGYGIHWSSGQEIGFRLLAWLFAMDVLLLRTKAGVAAAPMVRDALLAGATQIERHLDYARIAVYNNHLLSEALALFGVGALLPEAPSGIKWRELGRHLLDEQAEAQFYDDGAYIQQSHNYHRVALQNYLWACIFARAMGDSPSAVWLRALERSADFLYAHQNPTDGRLPNYGANDGALPSPLTVCDFSDLRPVLQSVSLLTRGERLYDEGPWDEAAAWFLGVRALDAPRRAQPHRSVAFENTGYYVMRGHDESTFSSLRCGTLRDRFSQIDMLHLDVWWKGQNVLVDPGSYRYNATSVWHEHFMGTGSHNTLMVDQRDQMLHYRQFKVLYWTRAQMLGFTDHETWTLAEGEHYGYQRHPGACVHRRAVLHVKDGFWIVADTLMGTGEHDARLHWLGGEFTWATAPLANGMDLNTPAGTFEVRLFSKTGSPISADIQSGLDAADGNPPRGWVSRYYGEKAAVPSMAAGLKGALPITVVTILGESLASPVVVDKYWKIQSGNRIVEFNLNDGRFSAVSARH